MSPLLALKNVSLKLGDPPQPVVNNVNLEVQAGDFLVVLGANGSGKSSLLRMVNGLYAPTDGQIALDGQLLNRRSVEKRARHIVTLTQDLNLSTFSDLTVEENCALASQRVCLPEPQALGSYLGSYHPSLPDRLKTLAGKLSGGERQSLALALALLHPPRLLILDEHTSALDPKAADRLMAQTHAALAHNQTTTLMTTHNLDDALRYGSRVIILCRGQVVFEANGEAKRRLTKQELLEHY